MSFDQFSVNHQCVRLLRDQGITEPTEVQRQAIPIAMDGHDLVAVAQTGTGKTLAFTLPAITRLVEGRGKSRGVQMLVLTPTRELAQQVAKVVQPLARELKLWTTCVYGGAGMEQQTKDLRRGADIVIATPGRLLDHLNRRNVRLDRVSVLVLDEADRMLDMGFLPDIRRIIGETPKDRQTLMFSATFPAEISRLTKEFQREPQRIEVGPIATPTDTVRQGVYTVDSARKTGLLAEILRKPGVESAIVFIRTKHRTDRVAKALHGQGFKAEAIHGGRTQGQRQKALDGFRRGNVKVLVATDVAARGIDVQGVTHVVNYDIPGSFDDYVHRIGRTARNNAAGDAITFVSPDEFRDLGTIERALGRQLPQEPWEGAVPVVSMFRPAGSKPANGRTSGFRKGRRPAPRRRVSRARA
jgi:ATP-dependent RNA helicase RhlE